ncbi:hypothetical protein [Bradyrhizobium elkanii]|uniref:hypothetical protein n=1 Tax=Bradyrhizobium elkanii TaxID=29448 RepID=UPI00272AA079|nr:hypothetical protein [Bradyrhizobium elkanii]WLA80368.1 hypothetical protein QNJ99_34030 [Bradyrhizobium elkanii]
MTDNETILHVADLLRDAVRFRHPADGKHVECDFTFPAEWCDLVEKVLRASAQGARQPCGCGVMCQDLGKDAGCRYMQTARRDLRKLVDLVYKHAADCVPMTLTADKLIDEVFGPVEPSELTEGERQSPADEIIAKIEERFPNWRSYRDLIDCIDCTLHQLREVQS